MFDNHISECEIGLLGPSQDTQQPGINKIYSYPGPLQIPSEQTQGLLEGHYIVFVLVFFFFKHITVLYCSAVAQLEKEFIDLIKIVRCFSAIAGTAGNVLKYTFI